MLHDGGHIAPGSHVAHSVWFPGQPDSHEAMSHMIIEEDPGLRVYLEHALGTVGYSNLCKIIHEPEDNPTIPRWTWQIITAGGFNTDRGDWVRRDSEQCGVHYGRYDLMPLEKGLLISEAGDLALKENAVPTLKAFFDKRADMYLNVYNYDGCRVGAQILVLIGQRARELYALGQLNYADETMQCVLSAKSGLQLALPVVLNMTESWWRGHVNEWSKCEDGPLSTLCKTLKQRKLFRIVRKNGEDDDANRQELLSRVRSCGLDERYFFMDMPPAEVNLAKDLKRAIKVVTAKGHVKELPECNEVLRAMEEIGKLRRPGFFAVPRSVFGQDSERLH